MATTTPVGYNPSQSLIPGTTQIGNLAVGTSPQQYSSKPGGITYWMGPDQDLGYVVAKPIPGGNQPFPRGTGETAAYVGFSRSNLLTQASFVNLANQIAAGATSWGPTGGTAAKAWLNANGYWTSYDGGGGGVTTGNYALLAAYQPASSNGSITFPNHNAPTFSLNPNLVGQSGYAIYINGNDLLGNSQTSVLDNLLGRNGTLTLTQGANSVVYSFTSTAFGFGGGYANQYWWDNQFNSSPLNTITVLTPASGNFNTVDPITITVS